MKIIAKSWYHPMGATFPIGIVVTLMDAAEQQQWDQTGPIAAWIGLSTPDTEEMLDATNIAKTGARFPLEAAAALFGKLEDLPSVEPVAMAEGAATVVRFGKLDTIICAPVTWTAEQIVKFADTANPIAAGWHIAPTAIRDTPCAVRVDFLHTTLTPILEPT